ncbi:sensor histidine kinase [Streptomyces sp. NPDC053499]|uniref:sensor histidine kinase n=1 Tax=Streptomyces sp. NPDC053499 TaxID=3365707 RepID=UPI0037D155B9
MISWGRQKRRKWQERSKLEQVEASTRWMLLLTPWIFLVSGTPQFLVQVSSQGQPMALAGVVVALGIVQCVIAVRGLRRGIDHYLGTGEVSRRLLIAGLVTFALSTAVVTVLVARGWAGGSSGPAMALFAGVPGLAGVYGLTVPWRRSAAVTAVGCAVVTCSFAVAGMAWPSLLGTLVVLAIGGVAGIFSPRCSAWYIAVMRELDEAREAQSRLAVAEERLRFSRDLHDVMGRNLSLIALQSELATQLARRGAASAVEQMREVQQLARQSQSEVRAVVRGYREAGLETELAGARSVLRAAGVDCRIESAQPEMAQEVQSALGWVVREGATNVLRHAEASRCTIRLTVGAADTTVLVMENDGLRPDPARDGSGLTGLSERLAALGGTLTAERDGAARVFRLRAEVPLTGHPSSGGAPVRAAADAATVGAAGAGAAAAGAAAADTAAAGAAAAGAATVGNAAGE